MIPLNNQPFSPICSHTDKSTPTLNFPHYPTSFPNRINDRSSNLQHIRTTPIFILLSPRLHYRNMDPEFTT